MGRRNNRRTLDGAHRRRRGRARYHLGPPIGNGTMLEHFGRCLKTTNVSWLVTYYPSVWPVCETLHFIGLAMLVGTVGALDLRMLGVAKGLPVGPMHRLIRWGIAGFLINLITGALFFAGTPYQYIGNIGFYAKMLLIVLAG